MNALVLNKDEVRPLAAEYVARVYRETPDLLFDVLAGGEKVYLNPGHQGTYDLENLLDGMSKESVTTYLANIDIYTDHNWDCILVQIDELIFKKIWDKAWAPKDIRK